jgi:hypothetical protein
VPERRIGVIKKVARAPGQALADFHIFRLIADAWGCGELFAEWTSPEAVFQILKRLSAGRPCGITGIRDYAMLDAAGGIQWPWPARGGEGESERGGEGETERQRDGERSFGSGLTIVSREGNGTARHSRSRKLEREKDDGSGIFLSSIFLSVLPALAHSCMCGP